jgi:selenophosphate synthetase-related protein
VTKNPPPFPVKTPRDVLLFEFPSGQVLVVSCDSSGGIGPKPLDKLKVNGCILGKFTARAALMEVLAAGADPVCVVDALGVEPSPLGAEILAGIRGEAEQAGLDPELAVTGSTEKNIAVEQTGIGVTVIGTCQKTQLKIGTSQAGDVVAVIGVPSVADEVLPAEKAGKIAETKDILKLRNLSFIHEIIPGGSTGILHELQTLAQGGNLRFEIAPQTEVDLKKSAGPATAVLAVLRREDLEKLKGAVEKPVNVVAVFLSEPLQRT